MKKILKFFLFLIILFIVGIAAYVGYIKFFASKGNVDAFNTVPKETVFIVETTDLSKAWTTIKNSELWKHLQSTDYFADLNQDIETINMFLDSNKIASDLIKNKKLVVSAVLTGGKDWDFLFSIDLKKGSSTIKALDKILDFIDGYQVTRITSKINDKKYEIIKLTDEKDPNSSIFISFADNILLVSFKNEIIQKSLHQLDNQHWQKDGKFVEIMTKIPERKLFKIYVKYSNLDKFMNTFLTTEDPTVQMLSKSLAYSVMNFTIEKNYLLLEGFTNLDSVDDYIKTLIDAGTGRMNAYKIMTNQTAAYVSLCFEDYPAFYDSLMNVYQKQSPQDYQDIDRTLNLLKNIIKIDVQKDFIDWIGNEIALFKVRPLSTQSREEDLIIAIQANDINDAKAGMSHIVSQIRKWSPFKFQSYEYKNHEINFLKQKNFFKPFFGKMFEGMEQPYFTYIENYVVFSNSEELLKQVIDDYITGNTLSNDEKFQDFIDQFDTRSNIAIFINMPKMYPTLLYFTPYKDRKSLKENEQLIKSFSFIGFQLLNKDNKFFKTKLFSVYDSTAYYDDIIQQLDAQTKIESFQDYIDTLGFAIQIPDTVADGRYVEYYDNGQIKYECDIINGKPQGTFRAYYEDGNLMYSVNYNEGKIEGSSYFYYNSNANTLRAEVEFEQNKVTGIYKEYYDNGSRKSKIFYEDGVENGDAEFYFPTGDLKIKGKYKDGKKNGRWIYYNEQGEKIGVEKWKKGRKVR